MDVHQFALMVAVILTTILAWELPRAPRWILLMTLSFIASSQYWDWHMVEPNKFVYPAMFAGLCDAFVVMVMMNVASQKWEFVLAKIIHVMIFFNVLWQMPGMWHNLMGWAPGTVETVAGLLSMRVEVGDKYIYGALLDGLNWVALICIGGTAVIQRAGVNGVATWCLTGNRIRTLRHYLLDTKTPSPNR